jgi:hypothetical protein
MKKPITMLKEAATTRLFNKFASRQNLEQILDINVLLCEEIDKAFKLGKRII